MTRLNGPSRASPVIPDRWDAGRFGHLPARPLQATSPRQPPAEAGDDRCHQAATIFDRPSWPRGPRTLLVLPSTERAGDARRRRPARLRDARHPATCDDSFNQPKQCSIDGVDPSRTRRRARGRAFGGRGAGGVVADIDPRARGARPGQACGSRPTAILTSRWRRRTTARLVGPADVSVVRAPSRGHPATCPGGPQRIANARPQPRPVTRAATGGRPSGDDQGPGRPTVAHVFERFYRADSLCHHPTTDAPPSVRSRASCWRRRASRRDRPGRDDVHPRGPGGGLRRRISPRALRRPAPSARGPGARAPRSPAAAGCR